VSGAVLAGLLSGSGRWRPGVAVCSRAGGGL